MDHIVHSGPRGGNRPKMSFSIVRTLSTFKMYIKFLNKKKIKSLAEVELILCQFEVSDFTKILIINRDPIFSTPNYLI